MSELDSARRPPNAWGVAAPVARALPSARFLRFLCIGLVNTMFGYTVFLVALQVEGNTGGALVASTVAGSLFNFQTSRRIVFRSRETGLLLPFASVCVVVLAINYAAISVLKQLGLANWAAQAALLLPMAMVAFALQRGFVFSDSRQPA